ncbi:MAG: response regulator [Myxococcota bacterium]
MNEAGEPRPSILVVDDDPQGIVALEMLLADPAYDRVTARSGREALRACLETEFALILMDVRMPEMDGFETATLLRSHHRFKETPIIFMTADPHGDAQRLRGYALGAVDYLTKPVEPVALRAKVSVFVALWRRTIEVRQQGERLRELEAREIRRELEERAQSTLRRADERVRAALEREALVFRAVPIVLYTRRVGEDPSVEWVSASADHVLGYPAARFADAEDFWRTHVNPEDVPAALAELRRLGKDEDRAAVTWRWRLPDGTERWFLEQAVLGRDGSEIVGTWLDVDRQKRLEEELRRTNEDLDRRVRERTAELENSMRQLEAFSYSVAHDLRAPLRAMHGFSRILVDACPDLSGEALDAQQRLVGAVHRMERLIDDLLELARVSRRPITRAQVDLVPMAREIVATLQERDPDRSVNLHVPEALRVDADPHLVRIALENLIGNAWKFSRPRPVAEIALGERDERLFVRDNGVGFDPAHAARLFEPFERLHGPNEFDGTGIGLATVRRIVERHGGCIRAEARPGEGATFWFTFRPPVLDPHGRADP